MASIETNMTKEEIYENVNLFEYTGEKMNTFGYIKSLNHTFFERDSKLPKKLGISIKDDDWNYFEMYEIAEKLDASFLHYEITKIETYDDSSRWETRKGSDITITDPVSKIDYLVRWSSFASSTPDMDDPDDYDRYDLPETNYFIKLLGEYYSCLKTISLFQGEEMYNLVTKTLYVLEQDIKATIFHSLDESVEGNVYGTRFLKF